MTTRSRKGCELIEAAVADKADGCNSTEENPPSAMDKPYGDQLSVRGSAGFEKMP